MTTTDYSQITHLEVDGTHCWITADKMAHWDFASAEERRDQLVSKFQTERKDSGET